VATQLRDPSLGSGLNIWFRLGGQSFLRNLAVESTDEVLKLQGSGVRCSRFRIRALGLGRDTLGDPRAPRSLKLSASIT
jgi:hypothetical protein